VLCRAVLTLLLLQVMLMMSILQSLRARGAVPRAHAQAARHPSCETWQWHAKTCSLLFVLMMRSKQQQRMVQQRAVAGGFGSCSWVSSVIVVLMEWWCFSRWACWHQLLFC
jgi:hypothetical protein